MGRNKLKYVGLAILAAVAAGSVGAATLIPKAQPPVSEKVAAAYATGTAAPTLAPPKDLPLVVFLGDSYIEGSNQDTGLQFPDILSTSKNWEPIMLGEGGSGYVTKGLRRSSFADRAPRAIGPNADMVIVSGGYNDSDVQNLPQASRDVLSQLRRGMPKIPIVVLSNFVPSGAPSETDLAKRDILADSAKRAGATFIDVTDMFTGHPELIGKDETHPTDAGHQHIAKVLAARLPAPRKG